MSKEKLREEFIVKWQEHFVRQPTPLTVDTVMEFVQASRAQADAEHKEEIAKKNAELLKSQHYHREKNIRMTEIEQQLSEANALIAMQAEALEGFIGNPNSDGFPYKKAAEALSASAESVAAWEAEKLLPLQRQMAMFGRIKELAAGLDAVTPQGRAARDEITIMLRGDTKATAEAYDREHAAKVLEEAASNFGVIGIVKAIEKELIRKATELRAQSTQKKEGE